MEKAPGGTSVGVDDPYDHVKRCDFVTDEGKCRWAREHGHHDPEFANARSADDFRCPAAIAPDDADADAEPEWDWGDCPHFRSRNHDRECVRCGLEERRMAHSEDRPLLEEHHLSYRDGGGELSHEITVFLCRWCHAKVHQSWARLDDDANPDPDAIAQQEQRRSKEQSELGFESAADRYDDS
ncbi:hypothetical protein Har1130_04005 [Haloarcula sp. CBA1130]|uniref:DUF7097 family protein n=1 Tax=unclassified Haloarcula TaxID=2624677 RepID=UPI0012488ED4|nr:MULTISPECIES: hypothetical protein [unclassified Haloarcula]KAA9398458.1 hypothetical protein Har1129_09655 [Haloarcula sp. CBA1129]KAA9401950.1 hypothetical protein Har1130_04005 [Haloarcula sp. CBA1130]